MSVNFGVSSNQLNKLKSRFFGASGADTKSDCPVTLTPEFVQWLQKKVDSLEWNRADGKNSVSPEDIAFITGQHKIVRILENEVEKQHGHGR